MRSSHDPSVLVDVHQVRPRSRSDLQDRSEYLAMAQTGLQDLEWAQGWGVIRVVQEKLEFVAFFDSREDAEAAAAECPTQNRIDRIRHAPLA